jgi:MFS family permease
VSESAGTGASASRRRAGPQGPLLALSIGALALFTAYFMTGTLAPLFGGALGASPAVIGVIVAAAFLFPFFLAIPVGSAVDAFGPKPMLLVGTATLGVAPLLVIAMPSLPSLIAAQVAAGLGQLIAVVAAQAVVASLGAGTDRERNFGWYGAFVSGGQLAGPLLAGVLVDLAGYRSAYAVAVAAAAAGVAAFLAVRVAAPGPSPAGAAASRTDGTASRSPGRSRRALPSPRALASLVRLPTAQASLWVSGTVMIVLIAHNSFLPAYLDELAVPASVIGVVLSARSAASVVVRPLMARVVRTLGGRLRTFVIALVASAAGVAGILSAPDLAWLLASAALIGLAIGVAQPLTMVAMVEQVPGEAHGVAFGTRITANRLAQFVAPLVLGVLAQAAGYGAMFVVAAAVIATTAAGLIARRHVYRAIDGGDPRVSERSSTR